MINIENQNKIKILTDIDQRTFDEMWMREFLGPILVQLDNGNIYSIFFATPTRIQSQINVSLKHGENWFAEPGLIVIPEVNSENINLALTQLISQKFFDDLLPLPSNI